jgi:hypothetical protein
MPLITRIYIRSALAYLVASLALLSLTLMNQGLQLSDRLWALQPVAYHLLAVGWTLQLIVGVAYWMFPMPGQGRERGGELPLWLAYGCLNGGLLLRAVAEPAHAWQPAAWSGAMLTMSGVLQAAATWLLVLALWPRVRARAGQRGAIATRDEA